MAFRYRLYLEDGEDIGRFETMAPAWRIGDELYDDANNRFRVTAAIPADDFCSDDYNGLLIVTPLALAEP